jgi:hypothetical protein
MMDPALPKGGVNILVVMITSLIANWLQVNSGAKENQDCRKGRYAV